MPAYCRLFSNRPGRIDREVTRFQTLLDFMAVDVDGVRDGKRTARPC